MADCTLFNFVVWGLIGSALCAFGYVGNLLSVFALQRDIRTPTTTLLQSLACSDLVLLLFVCITDAIPYICAYTGVCGDPWKVKLWTNVYNQCVVKLIWTGSYFNNATSNNWQLVMQFETSLEAGWQLFFIDSSRFTDEFVLNSHLDKLMFLFQTKNTACDTFFWGPYVKKISTLRLIWSKRTLHLNTSNTI